jgi:hypothetical protein
MGQHTTFATTSSSRRRQGPVLRCGLSSTEVWTGPRLRGDDGCGVPAFAGMTEFEPSLSEAV